MIRRNFTELDKVLGMLPKTLFKPKTLKFAEIAYLDICLKFINFPVNFRMEYGNGMRGKRNILEQCAIWSTSA